MQILQKVFVAALVAFILVLCSVQAAPADQGDDNVVPAVEVDSESTEAAVEAANMTLVYNELSCLRGGGHCLPEIECPKGSLSRERGLCPEQQSLGVECCHGLSLLETRCQARGGHCMDMRTCSHAVVEDRAEDCPDEKVCCVLVRS